MARQSNHNADIRNPNQGTPGTNMTWDKAQGNRGAQLNPNGEGRSQGGGSKPQGRER